MSFFDTISRIIQQGKDMVVKAIPSSKQTYVKPGKLDNSQFTSNPFLRTTPLTYKAPVIQPPVFGVPKTNAVIPPARTNTAQTTPEQTNLTMAQTVRDIIHGGKEVVKLGGGLVRGTARGAVAGGTFTGARLLGADVPTANQAQSTPKTGFEKFLLGNEPVSIQSEGITPLESMGVSPEKAKKYGAPFVLGSIALDVFTGGSSKAAKKALQKVASNMTADDATILRNMYARPVGNNMVKTSTNEQAIVRALKLDKLPHVEQKTAVANILKEYDKRWGGVEEALNPPVTPNRAGAMDIKKPNILEKTVILNKANTPVNKKLEAYRAGKPSLESGHIRNPLAKTPEPSPKDNQVVSSGNDSTLKTKINGVKVNDETLSRIKQAEAEGQLPNQKAGLSRERLDERRLRLDIQKEALDASPLKSFSKFTNKDGVLPEVTGTGKSIFARRGDEITSNAGFADSETARKAYESYNKELKVYRESKHALVADTKTFRTNRNQITDIEKAHVPLKRMTDSVKIAVTQSVKRVERKAAIRQVAFEKRETVRQVAKKRDEVTAILKRKAIDIQSVKRVVTSYVTENLVIADRGKAITLIRDAKSQNDVTKAFVRIQRVADERVKKELIADIKKTVSNLPQSVEIGYKNKVTGLLNEIELSGHSAKSIEDLKNTEKYLNQQQALGKDVAMPKRIVEKLKILSRTSAKDLTSSQLAGLRDEVELLKHLGKTKQRIKTELYEVEKTYVLDDLVQTIKPLNYKTIVNVPGTSPSLGAKTKNKFKEIYNRAKKVRVAIRPIDGLAEATGMEQMKNKMDLNYGNYLDHNVTFIKEREALLATSKLDKKNMERIGVYAAKMQEGGYAKLENLNISRADVDAVVLSPAEQTYYDFGRTWFETDYSNVKNYMQEVYNKDVGKVDNYVSFQTDFKAMSELEIQDQFGTLADDAIFKSKTVKKDFTEARSGAGTQKIKLDFDSILLRHRDNVAYMLNMGKDIKMYSEIVNNPSVRAKLGDLGTFAWKEWLDLMARKGGIDGQKQMAVIDMLRRNLGVGVMSYKLSTVLVQVSSLADAAATVGGKWTSIGAFDVASSKAARQFVLNNFPEIRQAVGDDIAFLELGDTFLGKAGQVGFVPLKRIDALARSTTALAAYRKIASDRGLVVDFANPNKSIIQEATKLVRQSQGSSSFKDSPLALTRGMVTGNVSADKAIFQFQSFMLNRWENIERQIWREGFGKGNYIKGFTAIFWMVVAAGVIEESTRRVSRGAINIITGDDKEEDPFIETVITNTTRNVPIAGNIMNSLAYDSNPVPIINAAEQTLGGFKRAFTGKETATKTKGAVDASLGTANALFGVPGTIQLGQLIKPFIGKEKGTGDTTLDKELKAQKTTTADTKEKIATDVAIYAKLTPDERAAKLKELAVTDKPYALKLRDRLREERTQSTWSDVDKGIAQLGVENGARAEYVYKKMKELPADKRGAYVNDLKNRKVISDAVYDQIKALHKKSKENNGIID